ncbi:MAG TPA: ABC transporter ATP-binding protein [Solirubrobacteraceae bacterium]|jgi:ATP-binding cassette subfamily B protein|nr:ABC transporter ATP-binding protein [Solirubrobacteraceae bacterium]
MPPFGSRERARERPRGSTRARLEMLIGDRRRLVVALSVCSILSGFAESATLALVAQIAVSFVTGAKHVQVHAGPLDIHASTGKLLLVAFGCTVARTALQFPLSILPARIAADVQARMRTKLFDAFTRASWAVQSRDREGQLQETMTNQVSSATAGATQVTILINAAFTFVVLTISALALNALAAVIVAVASIVLFGLLRPLRARGVRNARALSKAQVEYAGGIAESIRVAEEVHVFGVVGTQRKAIAVLVRASQELFYRTQVLGRLVANLYQSFIFVLLVAGLGGLYLIGRRHVGSLGGVVLILVRAGTAGQLVQGAYQSLAQSLPFIERIQETAERYLDSSPADGELTLPRVERIAFEDVGFAYNPGRPVLSGIGFEIERGEVIGIIGPSGAGKSTLVHLLLQLRVPDHGRYLVNGVEAAEFKRTDWTGQVAYVPQEPRLLHASVAENIRFYRELDDAAVERAAKLARIHDDVIGWPARYATIVGPRADAVSGGQQQRICLARALAARPEVLVLDEPTSALDPTSEALIGESLTALKHELTLFIIAHRMSTLDMCDRVMVIVDGRLAAFDTKALLQRDNTYYRHASQLAAGPRAR